MPPNKRLRVSADPSPSFRATTGSAGGRRQAGEAPRPELPVATAVPVARGAASTAAAAAAVAVPVTPESEQAPSFGLSEIAKLLMVDMQKNTAVEVAHAMQKLYTLIYKSHEKSRENNSEAKSLGAHTIVLLAMTKWKDSMHVQSLGAAVLSHLFWRASDDTRVVIIKSGGVRTLTNAIKRFPNEPRVIVNGYGTLHNFFSRECADQTTVDAATRHFVNDLGGIALVVQAMKAFPANDRVQRNSCLVLGVLLNTDEFRNSMVEAGVLLSLGAAFTHQTNSEQTKKYAGRCMKKLIG